MAQQGGGNDAFIQQMMGLIGLKNQMEQIHQQTLQRQSSALNTVFELARQVEHPEQQQALFNFGAAVTGMAPEGVQKLFAATAPLAETQIGLEVKSGLAAMTPAQRASEQGATATRMTTGMTPGAFASDQAVTRLSPFDLDRATKIGLDLLPGARLNEQTRQFNESTALGWEDARTRAASVAAQVRGQDLGYQGDLLRAQTAAAQSASTDTTRLLEEHTKVLQFFETNKGTLSAHEAQIAANALNTIKGELRKRGIPVGGDMDLGQVAPPSFMFGWKGLGQ